MRYCVKDLSAVKINGVHCIATYYPRCVSSIQGLLATGRCRTISLFLIIDNHVKNKKYVNFVSVSSLSGKNAAQKLKKTFSSSTYIWVKTLKLSPLGLRSLKIFPVQLFLSSNTFSACFNVPVNYCLIYYKFHPCFLRYQWLPLIKLIECIEVTSPKDKMHTMRHCKFETISDKCSKKGASLWKTSHFPFKSTLNLLQNKGNHCKIKWHTYGIFLCWTDWRENIWFNWKFYSEHLSLVYTTLCS